MFNITSYQRNTNENYSKISAHTVKMATIKKIHKQQMLERVCVERWEHSYTTGGGVNW